MVLRLGEIKQFLKQNSLSDMWHGLNWIDNIYTIKQAKDFLSRQFLWEMRRYCWCLANVHWTFYTNYFTVYNIGFQQHISMWGKVPGGANVKLL